MGKAFKKKTVPQPFLEGMVGVGPGRKVLKAGPAAIKAWESMVAEAERDAAERARDHVRAERHDAETHLARTEQDAQARGEEAERTQAGPLVIVRDGLVWALRKGTIDPVHYDAGLRFRKDYETANGTGVKSCLADPGFGGAFGPKSGPTDNMLRARGLVRDALAGLGSPMLHGYVQLVAGEGCLLSDERFAGEARAHQLPCRIAFDLLARGYGMIR